MVMHIGGDMTISVHSWERKPGSVHSWKCLDVSVPSWTQKHVSVHLWRQKHVSVHSWRRKHGSVHSWKGKHISVPSWKQKHVSWSVSSTYFVSSEDCSHLLAERVEVVAGWTAVAGAMPYRRPHVRRSRRVGWAAEAMHYQGPFVRRPQ